MQLDVSKNNKTHVTKTEENKSVSISAALAKKRAYNSSETIKGQLHILWVETVYYPEKNTKVKMDIS